MKSVKPCSFCGEQFESVRRGNDVCANCRKDPAYKHMMNNREKKPVDTVETCEYCGRQYLSSRHGDKYCRKQCARDAHKALISKMVGTCSQCGTPISERRVAYNNSTCPSCAYSNAAQSRVIHVECSVCKNPTTTQVGIKDPKCPRCQQIIINKRKRQHGGFVNYERTRGSEHHCKKCGSTFMAAWSHTGLCPVCKRKAKNTLTHNRKRVWKNVSKICCSCGGDTKNANAVICSKCYRDGIMSTTDFDKLMKQNIIANKRLRVDVGDLSRHIIEEHNPQLVRWAIGKSLCVLCGEHKAASLRNGTVVQRCVCKKCINASKKVSGKAPTSVTALKVNGVEVADRSLVIDACIIFVNRMTRHNRWIDTHHAKWVISMIKAGVVLKKYLSTKAYLDISVRQTAEYKSLWLPGLLNTQEAGGLSEAEFSIIE